MFTFIPDRSDGLPDAGTRTEKLLSTPSTSPAAEALAMGGQLSRDTSRFSELLAADRLLERTAESSALAGEAVPPREALGAEECVFIVEKV